MLEHNRNNKYGNKKSASVTDDFMNAIQYEEGKLPEAENEGELPVDEGNKVKPPVDEGNKIKPPVDEGNKVKPPVDECKPHPCCKYYYNLRFNDDCYDSYCRLCEQNFRPAI